MRQLANGRWTRPKKLADIETSFNKSAAWLLKNKLMAERDSCTQWPSMFFVNVNTGKFACDQGDPKLLLDKYQLHGYIFVIAQDYDRFVEELAYRAERRRIKTAKQQERRFLHGWRK